MDATQAAQKLIVALDVDGYDRAAELIEVLSPHAGWFKIGSVLFTREGPRVCRLVKDAGAELFVDLKFHDIPNTVSGAVDSAIALGADMLTLHTSGGEHMLRAAVEARERSGRSGVMIVGVTVLTHLALEEFGALFDSKRSPRDTVLALARTAKEAGLDGVVASAQELAAIRGEFGAGFKIVTPGIRLPGTSDDDQTRIVTPQQAVANGADFIVVGRPIVAAPDPAEAGRRIVENMLS